LESVYKRLFNPLYPPFLGELGNWGTPPDPWQEESCTSLRINLLNPPPSSSVIASSPEAGVAISPYLFVLAGTRGLLPRPSFEKDEEAMTLKPCGDTPKGEALNKEVTL